MKYKLLSEIHYFFGNQKDATFKTKNRKAFVKRCAEIRPFLKICRERKWTTIWYHTIQNPPI